MTSFGAMSCFRFERKNHQRGWPLIVVTNTTRRGGGSGRNS